MAYTTQYTGYVKFVRGSIAAWSSLVVKDPDTLYFISEAGSETGTLYLGEKLIAGGSEKPSLTLDELTNVLIDSGVSTNSLLVYDEEAGKWVNKTVSEVFSLAFGDMTGASADADGAHGLVPAPAAGQQNLFLQGDGTWADPIAASTTITSIQEDIESLQGIQTRLIGDDSNSSIREIAANEVAKIVNGATEAFDTLREIENWINEHPNTIDITALNSDVNNLKETVYGVEGGEGVEPVKGLTGKVASLETILNGDGTFDNPGVVKEITFIRDDVSSLETDMANMTGRVDGIDQKLKWQDLIESTEA